MIASRWLGAALYVAFLLSSPLLSTSAWATGFLDSVEDMPLMDGLTETGDGGIVFDKPGGRIVRTVATGNVAPDAVRSFYADTLPQLGWTRYPKLELIKGLLIFKREEERLDIQIVAHVNGATEVRFSIEPD